MIIELQRYNEVGELLIEKANTGSQGCICYQNGGQKVRRTTVAVHVERNGVTGADQTLRCMQGV